MGYYKSRKKKTNFKRYIYNEYIKFPKVRVVTEEGNLGIMETSEALKLAKEQEKDLILIAEKADPPVCKIMEFTKFKYQEQQKEHKAKVKSKKQKLKEFRISVNISPHDLDFRLKRARKFLENRDKVRFTLRFKGREIVHPELGYDKLNQILKELEDVGKAEDTIKKQGRSLVVTLIPK